MALPTMKIHPAARAFPTIGGKEAKEIKASIAKFGILQALLVSRDKKTIIDGRNRWAIAYELDLPLSRIPMEVYKGKEEEIPNVVVARNINRRHLTEDERIAIVTKLLGPQIEKKNEEAIKSGGKFSSGGEGAKQVAAAAKTTRHKALQALRVAKHAPEQLDDVIAGKTSLRKANSKVKFHRPQKKREKTLQEIVQAKFQRFMDAFRFDQRREVKAILRKLL